MSDARVPLGEATTGQGATGRPGREVTLPTETLVAGRGLLAGTTGSGTSNTAVAVAERLVQRGHGVTIVTRRGDYSGLAEHGDLVHVGPDGDLRATTDRTDSLASLAIEGRASLLVNPWESDGEAAPDRFVDALLRDLLEAADERVGSHLLVVDGIERYLGRADGVEAVGRIARLGPERGLGVCGVTRRPGEVPGKFVGRCDWTAWHRLGDAQDTKVVRRELDGEFATAVRDLDDREAFVATEATGVRRVRVDRASFAPRVNEGSLSLGESGSAGPSANGDDPRDDSPLRDALEDVIDRLDAVETDLAATRDFEVLADRLVEALRDAVDRPRATGRDRDAGATSSGSTGSSVDDGAPASSDASSAGEADDDRSDDPFAAFGAMLRGGSADDEDGPEETPNDEGPRTPGLGALSGLGSNGSDASDDSGDEDGPDEPAVAGEPTQGSHLSVRSISTEVASFERGASAEPTTPVPAGAADDPRPSPVVRAEAALASLDAVALAMAARYRTDGPRTPAEAYHEATGGDDRVAAYRTNRALRTAGVIEHVGRGYYDYCLPAALAAACEGSTDRTPEAYARDLARQHLEGNGVSTV